MEAADAESWVFERLTSEHERGSFRSGSPDLDNFLARSARQNQARDFSATTVLRIADAPRIWGYYSMCMGQVKFADLPESIIRSLPRYPAPAIHLARLAVDLDGQGKGYGKALLLHFFTTTLQATLFVPAYCIEVQAKDETARSFYEKYGFKSLQDDHLHMYMPMTAVRSALGA